MNSIREALHKMIIDSLGDYSIDIDGLVDELETYINKVREESNGFKYKEVEYIKKDTALEYTIKAVREAYRAGYFASGIRPTEDEVKKFDSEYLSYLQSIKEQK